MNANSTNTKPGAGLVRDYTDKAVLITGGTKGIGRACGLAFAQHGAQCYLTHRWGSADEGELKAAFEAVGGKAPIVLEADASRPKDIAPVLDAIAERHDGIEVFISNVCVVMRGDGVENHSARALIKSLEYSSWPFVEYLHAIGKKFEKYPRYAVAMSSDGPDRHYPGYDYVAVSKAVLETFVRYMSTHLRDEKSTGEGGCIVNALRTRQVITDSYKQIFGEANTRAVEAFGEFACTVEEVADTTLAMCSGLMDSLGGQVLTLDRGASFVDNVMTMAPRMMKLGAEGGNE